MKHKFIIITLMLQIIFLLTACGGRQSQTSTEATQNNSSNTNKTETTVANTDTSGFKPIKIRFANQHPTDSIASEADRRICAAIADATEGRVTVELYTDSSLGDYTSTIQELMMGTISKESIRFSVIKKSRYIHCSEFDSFLLYQIAINFLIISL